LIIEFSNDLKQNSGGYSLDEDGQNE
jgi:hypothetical protein